MSWWKKPSASMFVKIRSDKPEGIAAAIDLFSDYAFKAGYEAAIRDAAQLHENIDPSCMHEADNGTGTGAMGAIIAYRDGIRKLKPPVKEPPTDGL